MRASLSGGEPASVDLLRQRSSYPECPETVEPIETQLSWVFLTDRFAYKLRKPVRFDALDFSSSQQRHRACQDELRVNRRWAPDVYLAVLPITRAARGRLQLNGGGDPIDWVVKMRRLPPERTLRHLLVTDQLRDSELDAVAELLADHYSRQPPLVVQPDSYRRQLTNRVRVNLSDLLASLPALANTINQVHLSLLRHLIVQANSFDRRVCDGRVIDGHGDLRPDHVYVLSPPAVVDGLAAAGQSRQVDIADDLSLLAMECEQLGFGEVGQALLQRYMTLTGDRPTASLLAFYKSYRACLRARTQTLHAAQRKDARERADDLESAEAYVQQAAGYLAGLGPRVLIAVSGSSARKRSLLAGGLAAALGGERLPRGPGPMGCYSPEAAVAASYGPPAADGFPPTWNDTTLLHGQRLLRQGRSVILETRSLSHAQRIAVRQLADQQGATCVLVYCHRTGGASPDPPNVPPPLAESAPRSPSPHDAPRVSQPTTQDVPVSLQIDLRLPLEEQVQTALSYITTILGK